MKPAIFVGSSLRDLKAFPQSARRGAGFQIANVQRGDDPDNWKPMKNISPGIMEIRVHENGEFRVIYMAKFEEAVYVLHCFHKKTQKTGRHDIDLARKRYKEILEQRVKK